MNTTDWIGAAGVTILLFAYFLHLINKISQRSLVYMGLNFLGAGIACFAAIMLHYLPFIILEGAWTLVSLAALLQYLLRSER
jgi:hypothetical protein